MSLENNKDIDVIQLKERLESGDTFLFLDVREPHEYADANLKALNIPLGSILERIEEIEDHKEKEVIIHCRSGQRSGVAKDLLIKSGFQNVRNVQGGILHWAEKFGL